MRRWLTKMVLGAAVAACVSPMLAHAQLKGDPEAQKENQPATGKAAAAAAIPVKTVVLFSSGVGYFEHFGPVEGASRTELRFKTQQINDILKSLILEDMDGGKVTAVTYPSQDPVSKTLKSFQVDITS